MVISHSFLCVYQRVNHLPTGAGFRNQRWGAFIHALEDVVLLELQGDAGEAGGEPIDSQYHGRMDVEWDSYPLVN